MPSEASPQPTQGAHPWPWELLHGGTPVPVRRGTLQGQVIASDHTVPLLPTVSPRHPHQEERAHLEPGLALLPPRKTRRARNVGHGALPTTPHSTRHGARQKHGLPGQRASSSLVLLLRVGFQHLLFMFCGQEPPETLGAVSLPLPRLPHPPPPPGHLPGHPVSQPACSPGSASLSVSGNRTCRKVLALHLHTVVSTVQTERTLWLSHQPGAPGESPAPLWQVPPHGVGGIPGLPGSVWGCDSGTNALRSGLHGLWVFKAHFSPIVSHFFPSQTQRCKTQGCRGDWTSVSFG